MSTCYTPLTAGRRYISVESQYETIGKAVTERKQIREQIAVLEKKFQETGDMLLLLGKWLKEQPYNTATTCGQETRETWKTTINVLGNELDKYQKAKEDEERLTSEIRQYGGE